MVHITKGIIMEGRHRNCTMRVRHEDRDDE